MKTATVIESEEGMLVKFEKTGKRTFTYHVKKNEDICSKLLELTKSGWNIKYSK